MNNKIILISLLALLLALCATSVMFYLKVESRYEKIKEVEYINSQYRVLVNDLVLNQYLTDSIENELKKTSLIRRIPDSNYIILEPINNNYKEFYGFYIILDEKKRMKELGLHKP